MPFDYAVGHRKTKPGSISHFFGGEKGIEDVRQIGWKYSTAAILNVDPNILEPFPHSNIDLPLAIWHGLGSVQEKIDKYFPDAIINHLHPPDAQSDPGDMSITELYEVLQDFIPLDG